MNGRILVAHDVPRARSGGMARIMGFLHDRVAAAGHEITWFDADTVPASAGGALRRWRFGRAVRGAVVAAARAGRAYDVVNLHEPTAAPTFLPRRAPLPTVVVTSHGLEARAHTLAVEEARLGRDAPGAVRRAARRLATVWPARYALRRADHVFCLNTQDREYLRDRLGLPFGRTTRLVPGVEPRYAAASRDRSYDACSRIAFAGTWRKNKGIEDLVPACVDLAERHADVELRILGSGVPAEIVCRAFPPGVRSRVTVAEALDDHGTARELAASDLFLLPSLFEGTPLTLIEAMASGLPIVTTATCGMLDVIRDGENGLLVPLRAPGAIVAAIERLRNDEPLRRRLGETARRDAERDYNWDRVAQPVVAAYEALLDE